MNKVIDLYKLFRYNQGLYGILIDENYKENKFMEDNFNLIVESPTFDNELKYFLNFSDYKNKTVFKYNKYDIDDINKPILNIDFKKLKNKLEDLDKILTKLLNNSDKKHLLISTEFNNKVYIELYFYNIKEENLYFNYRLLSYDNLRFIFNQEIKKINIRDNEEDDEYDEDKKINLLNFHMENVKSLEIFFEMKNLTILPMRILLFYRTSIKEPEYGNIHNRNKYVNLMYEFIEFIYNYKPYTNIIRSNKILKILYTLDRFQNLEKNNYPRLKNIAEKAYNKRPAILGCFNKLFPLSQTIQKILKPTVNYIEFIDSGNNRSNNVILPFLLDHLPLKEFQGTDYPNEKEQYFNLDTELFEEGKTIPVKYEKSEYIKNLEANDCFCIGRTIFIKISDKKLMGIKIKKASEEIQELFQEKRVISWLSKDPQFSYLKTDDKDVVYQESSQNINHKILELLKEQIKNSNNGYTFDFLIDSTKSVLFITYYIEETELKLKEMESVDTLFARYNYSEISKDLRDPIKFTKYIENCTDICGCSIDKFYTASIINMFQAGHLIKKGLVHTSLINMFHNTGDDRIYLTTASMLNLQPNREGIGRLDVIMDAAKFSNFRLLGIADFAEIKPLKEFYKKIITTSSRTNPNNMLSTTVSLERMTELEALNNQFLSWIIVLLRKYFITDVKDGDYFNNRLDKNSKEIIVNKIKDVLIVYLSSYLNLKVSKTEQFLKSIGIDQELFKITVNQFAYFMTYDFVEDFQKPNLENILKDKKIVNRNTKITKPKLVDLSTVIKNKENTNPYKLTEMLENINPRGWVSLIVTHESKIMDVKYLGWFYWVSHSNRDELEKYLGLKLTKIEQSMNIFIKKDIKKNVLVVDLKNNPQFKTSTEVLQYVYNKLYPKIDAGPVNGSFPFQHLMLILNRAFGFAVCHEDINFSSNRDVGISIQKIIKGKESCPLQQLINLVKILSLDFNDLSQFTKDVDNIISKIKLNNGSDKERFIRCIRIIYNKCFTSSKLFLEDISERDQKYYEIDLLNRIKINTIKNMIFKIDKKDISMFKIFNSIKKDFEYFLKVINLTIQSEYELVNSINNNFNKGTYKIDLKNKPEFKKIIDDKFEVNSLYFYLDVDLLESKKELEEIIDYLS